MPSFKRLGLRHLSILPLLLLCAGTSACVQAPPVFLNAGPCSEFIPDDWSAGGVVSAPLPGGDTVGEWTSFADAQTGKLDDANGRTKAAIDIVKKCEAKYKAAADAMQPTPWWHFW